MHMLGCQGAIGSGNISEVWGRQRGKGSRGYAHAWWPGKPWIQELPFQQACADLECGQREEETGHKETCVDLNNLPGGWCRWCGWILDVPPFPFPLPSLLPPSVATRPPPPPPHLSTPMTPSTVGMPTP